MRGNDGTYRVADERCPVSRLMVPEDTTLIEAVRVIDRGGAGICLVTAPDGRLIGVLTDRDTRRAILEGKDHDAPIAPYTIRVPVTASAESDDSEVFALMQSSSRHQIPIVDAANRVVGLRLIGEFVGTIPLAIPNVKGNEWEYVKHCLDTNQLSSVGPYVDMFESRTAKYLSIGHGIACTSGTSALHVSLLLAGVRRDDEVILPTLTFIAPVNAATYCGAVPAFVDSEWATLGMCPDALAAFLDSRARRDGEDVIDRETGRRIGAIVVVHAFGHPADMDRLQAVCDGWNLPLVEDAAESLGAIYKGRHTGSFGRLGALSFNGNKIITSGGGGMVVTGDAALAKRGRHLTTQAKSDPLYYIHDEVGFNYRMSNIHAAVGLAQLERIEDHVARKRAVAARYIEALDRLNGVSVFVEQSWARSNYWLNTIFVPDSARDALLRHLNERNIMARPIWELNSRQSIYRDCPAGPTPRAEEIQARAINLPSSVAIGDDEVEYVCDTIRSWLRNASA